MSGGHFNGASFYAQQVAFDPRLAARASDPVTSHEAAAAATAFAGDQQQRVLQGLIKSGGRAGAAHIGWAIGMDAYAVRKRLPELERAGKVRRTGEKVLARTGRYEQQWELVA